MRHRLLMSIVVALAVAPAAAWFGHRAAGAERPADEAAADDPNRAADPDPDPDAAPAAGHSYHGEAFDEGPRQAAWLMEGMSNVEFPSSAQSADAQAFINQGVALLHGFAYLEAERSFRQAAMEEPELAIAYWGMALANTNNRPRARGLIAEAVQRNDGASQRERMYIDAADRWLGKTADDQDENDEQDQNDEQDESEEQQQDDEPKQKDDQKRREERYIDDLEKILHQFPDDVEAKALLALQLWQASRKGVPLTSHYAVNALLGEVFQANPRHPAHHYLIHLWDSERAERALPSAAMCGPAMPGVAHMWHMPGHIYSRLHRYADAAWQQEAAARVDHAHMIRTRIQPDQIHNFAHNNEWLIRNLLFLGRVDDALDQARNLISMPRHPKYNTLQKRGSFQFGRQRLLQALTEFGLWDQLIKEADGPYLAATDDPQAQNERLAWLAIAHYQTDQTKRAKQLTGQLRRRRLQLQMQLLDRAEEPTADTDPLPDDQPATATDAAPPAAPRKKSELRAEIKQLRAWTALGAAAAAAVRRRPELLDQQLAKAGKFDVVLQAQWLAQAGNREKALRVAEEAVQDKPGQVRPLAAWIDLLWHSQDKQHKQVAQQQFQKLRKLAAAADLELPLLARLAPLARAAGIEGDWRIAYKPPGDLGARPPLQELGPLRWKPYAAPSWTALTAQAQPTGSDAFQGRPTIVLFYLGFGCLHCVEQLQAFQPKADAFGQAGIDLVAISSETLDQLRLGMKNFDDPLNIPLLADPELKAFKDFRCYDDFEQQPLHGTFLIDAAGKVRWQDIGHEPFTDAGFLLDEAQRLLSLDQ